MAKQVLVRLLEDFLGEYVLNISKENLKVAAVRGKIKIEDVQLDGDLIGSHILGAVGLSGFGVMSCWAKSLKISVPWTNLEKGPTQLEVFGVHLVCVPLLPSTATRMCGAGTSVDPRCTLRTRAKRSALARLERNFFSRRIPGEGPSLQAQNGSRNGSGNSNPQNDKSMRRRSPPCTPLDNNDESDQSSTQIDTDQEKIDKEVSPAAAKQQNWKSKLKARIFRNIEAKITNIHLRCEVPEGGLDPGPANLFTSSSRAFGSDVPPDKRSFSFGFTLDSFVYKTANSNWETGNIDWDVDDNAEPKKQHRSFIGSSVDSDGWKFKVMEVNNMAMYWDDDPPLQISDCYILKTHSHMLPPQKVQARISAAMQAMTSLQDPGEEIMRTLQDKDFKKRATAKPSSPPCIDHTYCIDPSSLTVRAAFSDISLPGAPLCFAEVLPCCFELQFQPHQHQQYTKLRNTMFSQQRFDTMLHQRPVDRPSVDPKGWWRYIIACVVTRPNTRPWRDVVRITRSRSQYIELVVKKLLTAPEGNGFHGGLTDDESRELLDLENLLPIEALLTFHLVALRRVLGITNGVESSLEITGRPRERQVSSSRSPGRHRTKSGLGRIRRAWGGKGRRTEVEIEGDGLEVKLLSPADIFQSDDRSKDNSSQRRIAILHNEQPHSANGNEPMQLTVQVHDVFACLKLLDAVNARPILQTDVRASGYARLMALGKTALLFDLKQLEVQDCDAAARTLEMTKILTVSPPENNDLNTHLSLEPTASKKALASQALDPCYKERSAGHEICLTANDKVKPDDKTASFRFTEFTQSIDSYGAAVGSFTSSTEEEITGDTEIPLPPDGVACRVLASAAPECFSVNISSHPATLVWNKPCLDAVADFFSSPAPEMQSVLRSQLRDAATPLAHKAQLALMSPTRLSVNMNIDAPKLWIPVSAKHSGDGALFLDAGKFRVSFSKPEGTTDTHWVVDGCDIQVKFAKGVTGLFRSGDLSENNLDQSSKSNEKYRREEITVIRPFFVHLDAELIGEKEIRTVLTKDRSADNLGVKSSLEVILPSPAISGVSVDVGIIYLNLVDVEVLASAIGKWYAAELLRVKLRSHNASLKATEFSHRQTQQEENQRTQNRAVDGLSSTTSPLELTISVEKIEMVFEGNSAQDLHPSAIHQTRGFPAQMHSQHAFTLKRTYMVEIYGIDVSRGQSGYSTTSHFFMEDISIVQMKYATTKETGKHLYPSPEPRHHILVRARSPIDDSARSLTSNVEQSPLFPAKSGVLTASHLSDGENHLDEVEIDVESVVFRITPTSMRDCAQALQRILELVELKTKEMERRVHEEGRSARKRGFGSRGRSIGRMAESSAPRSPLEFDKRDTTHDAASAKLNDSSLLFKATMKQAVVLVGRPALSVDSEPLVPTAQSATGKDAVVQVLSNVLVMFQSIENADASGTKTIHISIDNLSTSINTKFEPVALSEVPPMIGPTAAEFRVAYTTENLGSVVSQDFSFDCDSLKLCLTPNDIRILNSVGRKILERLRTFGSRTGDDCSNGNDGDLGIPRIQQEESARKNFFSSFIRYKKRGTGIATSVRFECLSFSFVLLRGYKVNVGARPLFDFNATDTKGKLEGCASAMSGEARSQVALNFFNSDIADWEYVVEPFFVVVYVEQLPNELVLDVSSSASISVNMTAVLLRDVAAMEFELLRLSSQVQSAILKTEEATMGSLSLTPSAISTIGLRRATESHSISLLNESGLDILICPMEFITSSATARRREFDKNNDACTLVKDGSRIPLDYCVEANGNCQLSGMISRAFPLVALALSLNSERNVGERNAIFDLPIATLNHSLSVHRLQPLSPASLNGTLSSPKDARASPETALSGFSDIPGPTSSLYNIEPVVEWCMQNQRLRSTTSDIFSLEKGEDLLSSSTWSPSDDFPLQSDTSHGHWLRPYLKNDCPEWTDMAFLDMARERVMLPDNNWIWANDWTVDLNGTYGYATDADGWEYETDFETFNRSRRFYHRGDVCRRRRWTRTRIIKPPRLDDRTRPMSIVWESTKDENGNYTLKVTSPLKVHNRTCTSLTFFVFSYSWEDDTIVGSAGPGKHVSVPAHLACATYLRLAKAKRGSTVRRSTSDKSCVTGYAFSERLMILPSSHTSSLLLRTSISLSGSDSMLYGSDAKTFHFLVHIKCTSGVTDIFIEPIVKIVNLLPCQLQYRLGEKAVQEKEKGINKNALFGYRHKISVTDERTVEVGEETTAMAIDPKMRPHLSLRVPGYNWSNWQRIVNRKAGSNSWQAPDDEENLLYSSLKEDSRHAEEYTTIVQFERLAADGDSLVVIMSVEAGHCPTVRIYSQFWILDKTAFGLRFTDSFVNLLGSVPSQETSRRSYLLLRDANHVGITEDMHLPGNQWSIGMSGMSMYFSKKQRLAVCIESGAGDDKQSFGHEQVHSKWSSLMDVSNVMPKTVFSLDELEGQKRFELSINVTLCPSLFSRTKFVTVFPRYQIVNLLERGLYVAQDGCLCSATFIPPQSSVPFHWDITTLPPKVRLCTTTDKTFSCEEVGYNNNWTNGSIQLDKVGITSMRLPGEEFRSAGSSTVIQAEVRLATKEQSSAVVIVIWSTNNKANPLYLLRNKSSFKILCSQPLDKESDEGHATDDLPFSACSILHQPVKAFDGRSLRRALKRRNDKLSHRNRGGGVSALTGFECGIMSGLIRENNKDIFIWTLRRGDVTCFGFDDPDKPHVLEWTCAAGSGPLFDVLYGKIAVVDVDAMGSSSVLCLPGGKQVGCQIRAEHSTKVIEFVDLTDNVINTHWHGVGNEFLQSLREKAAHHQVALESDEIEVTNAEDDEYVVVTLHVDLPQVIVSVVDNCSEGREILLLHMESLMIEFSQSRDGYHELELRLMSMQLDNHVYKSIHPVVVFCPSLDHREPFLHISAVRRLQMHSSTYVFRYAALRMLAIDIFLDRRTAETVARFMEPLRKVKEVHSDDPANWIATVTSRMASKYAKPNRRAPRDIEQLIYTANSGRFYFEHLHLHPIRLSLTFTQEWVDANSATDGVAIFQLVKGLPSLSSAPLTFTSFVVSHAFEAPQALIRIIAAHYTSQLTQQIFSILGSLAILNGPADFLANVGTGVRDFFYEPFQGLMRSPAEFLEGLENGTTSLARGVFVGVVRGAANVTEVVNANLAGLTDDVFIFERNAYQRSLTDALSRGASPRTIGDSLYLAGSSVVRGIRSGAMGVIEQPSLYASRHGPVGFAKGIGKAIVGAILKPVVGVGDAAVLVMNHVSEATSNKTVVLKIPKRLRRALPRKIPDQRQSVKLVPYDDQAASAQKIVTANESIDDVYIGHVSIAIHVMIASEKCLWAISRNSRDPWCLSWEEISHFGMGDGRSMEITFFSQTGLQSQRFEVDSASDFAQLYYLLSMQLGRMGNGSSTVVELDSLNFNGGVEHLSQYRIPGIKAKQNDHIFGTWNTQRRRISSVAKDELDVIEQCFARVKTLGSELPTFFCSLDDEAWTLIDLWGQFSSGLSSKRCIAVGVINGTGSSVQIKSTKLVEGGSPVYHIPTKEFDDEQGVLRPGGAILFFAWGVVPNLMQAGRVFLTIETNAFVCELSDRKRPPARAYAMSGYRVGFLEKSYDSSGWWSKYWLLVRSVN